MFNIYIAKVLHSLVCRLFLPIQGSDIVLPVYVGKCSNKK